MEWWLNHVGQMAQSVQDYSQNTISETSAWTTSTVSEVNNQSYAVYANTQIVIDEESKTQNII